MNIFLLGFLIIPIVAIAAKEIFHWKISRWFIFVAYVLIGWLLWYLHVQRYFELLDELVRNTPKPSAELLERWQSDGAANAFALFFGWAFAAIYFLACLIIVFIIRDIGKALRTIRE